MAALLWTAYRTADHNAVVISLFAQTIGLAVGSHLLADVPYRVVFRSPQFIKAFRFGYPLMFNGAGLALSSQADRFLVGAMLGLPALGVYNVAILVTVLPISGLFRLMGTSMLAAFHNAGDANGVLAASIKIAARLSPFVATVYALGVVTLMNIVAPIAFGQKFLISRLSASILALAAFFRIIRSEPFTSLLLLERRTKRLALANLSVMSGLASAALLMAFQRTFEAALVGRLTGELIGLGITLFLTRTLFTAGVADLCASTAFGLALVGSACAWSFFSPLGVDLALSIKALFVYALCLLPWGVAIAMRGAPFRSAKPLRPKRQ